MPRRLETWVSLCNLMLKLRGISHSSAIHGSDSPQSNNRNCKWLLAKKSVMIYMVPTSISGHNIIGLIAVWYIDITEDIVAFVLVKITSSAKRVKYYV